MFDMLIPSMHGHLYSLYCILDQSSVLDACTFGVPRVDGEKLTVPISIPDDEQKRCTEYLDANDYLCKYLRKHRYSVQVGMISSGIEIILQPTA